MAISAILFVVYKVMDAPITGLESLNWGAKQYLLFSICFLLLLVNWGIEAYKWKRLIKSSVTISSIQALRTIFTSVTVGLITPNRIGEIPARVLLVKGKNNTKQLVYATLVGAYSQMLVTLGAGSLGLYYTQHHFDRFITFKYASAILLMAFMVLFIATFQLNKIKSLILKIPFLAHQKAIIAIQEFSFTEIITAMVLSAFRYGIFFAQYFMLLYLFNINFQTITNLGLIAVCFMVSSFIPSILLSEIGIRSSVALVVFGTLSSDNVAILICSLMLWVINVGFPALIGIFNLKNLHIPQNR